MATSETGNLGGTDAGIFESPPVRLNAAMQNATKGRPSPPATSAGGEIIRDPLVYVDEHGQERVCAPHQVTNTSRKAAEVISQLVTGKGAVLMMEHGR